MIKGNTQFIPKVIFEPSIDLKNMKVENVTKAAIFKSFLHLSYQNTQLLVTVLFSIFMKRTLTVDYSGLHKNMNWASPLKHVIVIED